MTKAARRDLLEGLAGYPAGPWRYLMDGIHGAFVRADTDGEIYVARVSGQREDCESVVRLISRAPELVDEVRELRAVLSECAKQLAAMGADAHANRARALLPDTEDE